MYDTFTFFGNQIVKKEPGWYNMSQTHYVNQLWTLAGDTTFTDFRRSRAILAWMVHSRSDLACAANKAAQVTENLFEKEHITKFNKAVRVAKTMRQEELAFKSLNQYTLHFHVYADASFSSNEDLSLQLGYIILLCDSTGRCHVLDFTNKKVKRVVRSVMACEHFSFTKIFDASVPLAVDLKNVLGKKVPSHMFTDSKQVFDVVAHDKLPSERRLAIGILVLRDAYRRFEIYCIVLVKGEHNPAYGMTKQKHNRTLEKL